MPGPRLRVCTQPGCPELCTTTRCQDHTREADRARGTRQQRGYDKHHDQLRRQLDPIVKAGGVLCWRCHQPIPPNGPWQLGHSDTDRNTHNGPEHVACNTATTGRERAPREFVPPGG